MRLYFDISKSFDLYIEYVPWRITLSALSAARWRWFYHTATGRILTSHFNTLNSLGKSEAGPGDKGA
jgi:hypothetical protein